MWNRRRARRQTVRATATIDREDVVAIWDGLCVAAQYEPGNTRHPWRRTTGWPRFRVAMLRFALAHGNPDAAVDTAVSDPTFDIDWCAGCFGPEGCIGCAGEPRPHHGCLGWLCVCSCNGEDE